MPSSAKYHQAVGEGFEHTPKLPEKTPLSETGGAKTDAIGAQTALIDAELRSVVDAWSGLSDTTKKDILALVRACCE
jgi:hypothetical protein